jgi:hypothetical protein
MITGLLSLNIYQCPDGDTHTYVCLDIDRNFEGPVPPLTGGHNYQDFSPSLTGLKECKISCDSVSVSFRMGKIFPIATIKADGHTGVQMVVPWNSRAKFSLLSYQEAEAESFERACQSEKDGEYARYNACEQY